MNNALSTAPTAAAPPVTALRMDAHDLSERLLQATANDTCKGMFFNGLFLATAHTVGEAGVERLREAATTKKFVDFFNYPIADFLPLAWRAAELVGGGSSPKQLEAGIRKIGAQATDDFLATAVGKTLMMLSGHDAKRLMNSLASSYKTAVSYGSRAIVWHAPNRCVFTMHRDFMPHPYHEGVITQVLTVIGRAEVRVVGRRTGLLDTDYDISWR